MWMQPLRGPPSGRGQPQNGEPTCKFIKIDGETFRAARRLAAKVGLSHLAWRKGLSPSQLNGDLGCCPCGPDGTATAEALGKLEVGCEESPACRGLVSALEAQPEVRRPAHQPQPQHPG